MKAIVCEAYGDPEALRLNDVEKPTPSEGEVLLRVHAGSLNALDWHLMKGRPPFVRLFLGLKKPKRKRPGNDVAGRVESVGPGVTRFRVGDDVFGLCRGSMAEYASARELALAAKPANISFEEAASVPVAGLTALQGLRDHGRIQPGQRVLINGAAGGVGTFAVQIAKSFGAEVTGVCSTANIEMIRAIGADHVVDYTEADFTRGTASYDLLYDLVANHSLSEYRRILSPRGIVVAAGIGGSDGRMGGRRVGRLLTGMVASWFGHHKLVMYVTRLSTEDLVTLAGLLQSGKVKPVLDSRYPLSETSRAMRRLAEGHAHGKVVVTVDARRWDSRSKDRGPPHRIADSDRNPP